MFIKGYIPYYKRNLKVAVPIMLTQAGQITVNLADNIMVGHLGTAELAGVSFANSILILGMEMLKNSMIIYSIQYPILKRTEQNKT